MSTSINLLEKPIDLDVDAKKSLLVEGLSRLLADTFCLYLKTLNCHWNVQGERFVAIHQLTETHYKKMQGLVDDAAERIRMLGFFAPGSLKDFMNLTSLTEAEASGVGADEMLESLTTDHGVLIDRLEETINFCEQISDSSTADLLTQQKLFHEEASWMLRSLRSH